MTVSAIAVLGVALFLLCCTVQMWPFSTSMTNYFLFSLFSNIFSCLQDHTIIWFIFQSKLSLWSRKGTHTLNDTEFYFLIPEVKKGKKASRNIPVHNRLHLCNCTDAGIHKPLFLPSGVWSLMWTGFAILWQLRPKDASEQVTISVTEQNWNYSAISILKKGAKSGFCSFAIL